MLINSSLLQVKLVIEDQLVLTDRKVNSETLDVPAPLVYKDFVVYPVELAHLANPVVLVNVVCPALTVKTVNKDLRVFKVFLDLSVFLENADLW